VDGVVVVRIRGRLTAGEPSESLSDFISRLISAGHTRVVVDLTDVPQIDSTGLSTLVKISISLARVHGGLLLSAGPGKLRDALTVTRLVEAIPTFHSAVAALEMFVAQPLYLYCPVCNGRGEPPTEKGALSLPRQTCSRCDCQFSAVPMTSMISADAPIALSTARIFPYKTEAEYIEIEAGPPTILNIVGRLDLFGSHAIKTALHVIPAPRNVTIDLARVTEISGGGRGALLALIAEKERNDKISVSLEGLSPGMLGQLSNLSKFFYFAKEDALAFLGRIDRESRWLLRSGTIL